MQRRKPPQNHTDDAGFSEEVTFRPIGVVHSPYKERFGTPRQPNVTQQVMGDAQLEASIELFEHTKYERSLQGLEGFEYIWVVFWMHLNSTWGPMVKPPRGPKKKMGVFATRSPNRPNPIGLSALKLTGIEGRMLKVIGLDILDGTPVLDIKPYVPYADAFEGAKAGWLDSMGDAMDGPDYWSAEKQS